jgi:ribosomal subunit interface protein
MEIRIQSIHFDATSALEKFIEKKVSKLSQYYDGILQAEVTLKVVKPETALNKEVQIKLTVSHSDMFASKVSDTFEESVDDAVDALQKQLVKFKEKSQSK